ncbi:MAG: class I SAM-dependent methyltransferase [Chitinophagaceae bacterium]|nr:class I SAM-dependent methyltransferase [Chitinophagaceae bacterium]MCW5925446.1 class I SAM-dependent methyltransferase [Chitinophagaceae bacterium]
MIRFLAKAWNYLFGKRTGIIMVESLKFWRHKRTADYNYFDYIRVSTLELIVHELKNKNVGGEMAELGVYKGKFARYFNAYFPDKKLFLFDTFRGFDNRNRSTELSNEYSSTWQDFADTTIDQVLNSMPHPGKCIVRKGLFPETAGGLEETFCLVSLDCDLYEPIYDGLKYFYPRLVKNGYILIHDFNNDSYKGVRAAVEKFCEEENINVVPLADVCGTCIITR